MSYCVQCGVELDASLKSCPLCGTPVLNPNHPDGIDAPSPFPKERGQVETVRSKDVAFVLTTFLVSAAAACALLNLLTFRRTLWSLPVIGLCLLIWVFSLPFTLLRQMPPSLALLLDGAAAAVYLYLLTFLTASNRWCYRVGLPIVLLVTVLAQALVFLQRRLALSFLGFSLFLLIAAALLCLGIESILDRFLHGSVSLGWSAVVLTACGITAAVLAAILSKKRLRSALKRRLHL